MFIERKYEKIIGIGETGLDFYYNHSDKNIQKESFIAHIHAASDLNIPLIDIHEEFFIKQPDPIGFFAHRIYGHYSPDGYNEISKIILNKINIAN